MKIATKSQALSILMLVLFSVSSSHSNLSTESQKAIGISALKGGLTSLATYISGYWLFNDFEFPRVQDHQWAYGLTTAFGAATMAAWRYNHVPEAYFDSAKNEVEQLGNNELLGMTLEYKKDEIVAALKQYFFRSQFPLVSAFRSLDAIFLRLETNYASLDNVLRSHRSDLYEECYALQVLIQVYADAIRSVMNAIREDAGFIAESNAQTAIELQHAQQVAATAAMVNAFRPATSYVYVR